MNDTKIELTCEWEVYQDECDIEYMEQYAKKSNTYEDWLSEFGYRVKEK